MKENRKLNGVSALYRKGFVSLYFLLLFLLITLLISILLHRQENRMRTASNLRKSSLYLSEEAVVMNYLRCELSNERMESGSHWADGVEFEASATSSGWRITIASPFPEVLEVTCTSSGKIYDYDVIRDETPA